MHSNTHRRCLPHLHWLLATAFFFYQFFLGTFLGTLATQIIADMQLSAVQFSQLGASFILAFGAMQMPNAWLINKLGYTPASCMALGFCSLGLCLFASTHSFGLALCAQLMMGTGAASAFVGLMHTIRCTMPTQQQGWYLGLSQCLGGSGSMMAASPLLSYMRYLQQDWRVTLYHISATGGVLAVLLVCSHAMTRMAHRPHTPLKTHHPLPLLGDVLRSSQITAIVLCAAMTYVALSTLGAIWGNEYLQTRGLTQSHAAKVITFAWSGYVLGSPLIGKLSDYLQQRKAMCYLGGGLGLISMAGIAYLPQASLWLYATLFLMLGIAASTVNIYYLAASESVPNAHQAMVVGYTNTCISVLCLMTPIGLGLLIDHRTAHGVGAYQAQSFIPGLTILACFYATVIWVVKYRVKESFPRLK